MLENEQPIFFSEELEIASQEEPSQNLFFTVDETPANVILLGIDLGKYDAERSMQELSALAEANNMQPVAEVLQKRSSPDRATALGIGRLEEARLLAQNLQAAAAVYDGELSGSQIRNLEERLTIPVYDRTMLILSIFKNRAISKEGKLQTELATLEYRLPRLSGLGTSLSRQGGGGGGGGGARRGGGETKLEYDRRYIRSRIALLKKKLEEVKARREENRRSREKSGVPVVALVGYTNVGKSSLVNALSGSDIGAADMLFATLDPTARSLTLPDGQTIIIIDTVGFVSRLPHNLVEAFKSTLEEAAYADLLIKVADAADPEAPDQLEVTDTVLSSLGCSHTPQLVVYNKADKAPGFASPSPAALLVSAHTGLGLEELLAYISKELSGRVCEIKVLLPYDKLSLADTLRRFGVVRKEEYQPDGVYFEGQIEISKAHHFQPYFYTGE